MIFLLGGRMQKTLKKEKNRQKKILKNEENEEYKQIIHLWFYLLYKKLYFARKHSFKKAVYTITFHLQFLCVAGYLKRSNDTPELNIHKYTNYNIMEIYINRLSTTMQTFIAMDFDTDAREVPSF